MGRCFLHCERVFAFCAWEFMKVIIGVHQAGRLGSRSTMESSLVEKDFEAMGNKLRLTIISSMDNKMDTGPGTGIQYQYTEGQRTWYTQESP